MTATRQHTVGEPAEAQRTPGGDRQRAEEHHRSGLAGHVAAERAQQQAGARRVRPGPHGNHRPGRAAEGPASSSSTRCRTRAGPTAWCSCRTGVRSRSTPSSRSRRSPPSARPRPMTRASTPASRLRQDVGRHVSDIAAEIPDPGRDAGHGADVRAVGVGLCRTARRLRRPVPEGLSRQGRHRLALAADARHSRHPADPARRAHAGGRRQDPRRGRPPDGRHRRGCTIACSACSGTSARPTRTCGRS